MNTVSHVCSQLGSRSHQRRSDLHRKKAQLFAFSAGSCAGVGVRGQSCEPSNLARGRQKGVFIEHLICARYWASHLIPNTLEKGVWSSSCINNHPPTPPTLPAQSGSRLVQGRPQRAAEEGTCAVHVRSLLFIGSFSFLCPPMLLDPNVIPSKQSPKCHPSRNRQRVWGGEALGSLRCWRELFGERRQWDLARTLHRRCLLGEQDRNTYPEICPSLCTRRPCS